MECNKFTFPYPDVEPLILSQWTLFLKYTIKIKDLHQKNHNMPFGKQNVMINSIKCFPNIQENDLVPVAFVHV